MKPSDIVDTFTTGGIAGLSEAFNERKTKVMQGVPDNLGEQMQDMF